jgi:hypothetical protein
MDANGDVVLVRQASADAEEDDEPDIAHSPLELAKLLQEVAVFLTSSAEGLSVLTPAELDLWRALRVTSTTTRAVVAGLFSRKQKPLRLLDYMNQLAAKRIPVPSSIIEAQKMQAVEIGLYSARSKDSLAKLLDHLRVPELKVLAKATGNVTGTKKKAEYIQIVSELASKQKSILRDTEGNIRLSSGRKERMGPYWDEAVAVVGESN